MTKNRQRKLKFQAMREDLLERDWRAFRADFQFEFKPKPVQDAAMTSRLLGPEMKTIQWEPSVKGRSRAN